MPTFGWLIPILAGTLLTGGDPGRAGAQPEIFFQEGFESGDFSAWDKAENVGCKGFGKIAVSSDPARAHSGGHAAELHFRIPAGRCAEVQDQNLFLQKTISSSEHVFVRGYVYFQSPATGASRNMMRKIMRLQPEDHSWEVTLTSDPYGTPPGAIIGSRVSVVNPPTGEQPFWSTGQLFYDRWHALELEVKLNKPGLADGYVALYVDGGKVWEKAELNVRGDSTSGMVHVAFGYQSQRQASEPCDEYRYWDDIVIAGRSIGP